jgi:hypothetical protein
MRGVVGLMVAVGLALWPSGAGAQQQGPSEQDLAETCEIVTQALRDPVLWAGRMRSRIEQYPQYLTLGTVRDETFQAWWYSYLVQPFPRMAPRFRALAAQPIETELLLQNWDSAFWRQIMDRANATWERCQALGY